MYPTSGSFVPTDPNVNRVIEETVAIVNDVDQRLQALKLGIAQALPHLAPILAARDPTTAALLSTRIGMPYSPLGNVPNIMGIPGVHSFGQIPNVTSLAGYPTTPFGLGSTFGSPFTTGITQPFTGVSPFLGVGSFRPW